ncbi:MAG: (1-_4)-alpha-D-glucan 1-alpha-D-glucosylmutase [Planctomycetota bacterium]|nr:(1->4)-alpha-D-glucan 1-alpha-D-glucosylmutase [Planctomycetota bacterium]
MDSDNLSTPRIPVSTYRLQFNRRFKFCDAKKIICYFHDLGITDIYASPYCKAREGSLHGYDIVDHNTLNPEIGTEEEYHEMVQELGKYQMGQMLDIVPNHMCITSKENTWWMDVLENGPSSPYANFFDIDWDPVKTELKNKILIPVLSAQYGIILERQELRLAFENGAFFIHYYQHKLPIIPKTYIDIFQHRVDELKNQLSAENPCFLEFLSIITALNNLPAYTEKNPEKIAERYREKEIIKKRLWNLYNESSEIKAFIDENIRIFNGTKGKTESFDHLDKLLNSQIYRLSHWCVATDEINYRRFFDINDLAAIRMEYPGVFTETHKLIFRLIREGKVTGLRVDHPDGLYNPSEYFQKLQRNCFLHKGIGALKNVADHPDSEAELVKQYDDRLLSDPHMKPFYIVGEKILIKGEKTPEDWPIYGTTGYDYLNSLNGLFVETVNAKAFDDIYTRFIKSKINFQDSIYEKKILIMETVMSSEVNTLGHFLNRLSEKNRHTRDFTLNSLTVVIKEVIAFFPVYRTYIQSPGVSERDRKYIEQAVSKAKRKNPAVSASIFDFLKDVILLKYPENFEDDDKKDWLDFVMRFQQITGPVMAKGLEDTTFYVYNRFLSLNDVGGSPDRFGTPIETFHGQNIERFKFCPHALITTSTHDSKRSEDVRARLNVLSEIPDEWRERLIRWRRLNKKKKAVVEGQEIPGTNEEYLLYQSLIGVWPVEPMDKSEYEVFKKRIKDYMVKATREAKVHTSWISPNTMYEDTLINFIETILNNFRGNKFLKDFQTFQKKISHYGMFNALSQTLLKITSPGVPDFYQGTELWDLSLVDPDNRRLVDYSIRIKILEELKRNEEEMPLSKLAKELTINKDDGKIKLYLMYKALNYRKTNREIFERGEYSPLEAMGEKATNVCSFVRKFRNSTVLVFVPRFITRLIQQPESLPFGKDVWKDSFIIVPHEETEEKYRNIFTGEVVTTIRHKETTILYLSEIFAHFPVALMERIA